MTDTFDRGEGRPQLVIGITGVTVVRCDRDCAPPPPPAVAATPRRFDAAALRLHYESLGQVSASLSEMGPDGDVADTVRYLGAAMGSLGQAIATATTEQEGDVLGRALAHLTRLGAQDGEVQTFLAELGLVMEDQVNRG